VLGDERVGLRLEVDIEAVVGGEHEGPAVVAVVVEEEVGHRGLGAGGLDGGMRVDNGGRGVEAGVADAGDADLAVVVGDVLEEELDGVVGVGGLVGLIGGLVVDVGAHLLEDALAVGAATNVLADEDVAGLEQLLADAEAGWCFVLAVRGAAIRGAGHEKRVGALVLEGSLLRNVDGGEEVDAVAHGDAVLILGVVGLDEVLSGGSGWGLGDGTVDGSCNKDRCCYECKTEPHGVAFIESDVGEV